ncbi:alpha/beta hydrolase family protein [Solimicrobium silvestre]|uniref:Prolyl oligopeptidase family n=1 Tax=Solimicrobium silvestre TaxID=2099400 RepID=A0A2S9GZ89_9BURK|nr:alpha/beta fold hydrolase [Solimicrobium silvestre]PRC93044.1 Prolyl oligopeptidase family [Solimicrobium silvestre]
MNKHPLVTFLCALILIPSCHLALSADSLPSVESFFKDPEIRQAILSPNGHSIAILSKLPDGRQVIAVRDTSDLQKVTVPVTATDDKITSFNWVNENRISFTLMSTRLEFIGNLDLFAVNLDGSNRTHLISGNWKHKLQNTGSNIIEKTLTADYSYFGSTHDGSDDIIVSKITYNHFEVLSHYLFRLDTKTRSLTALHKGKQPGNVYYWELDANDVPRIALSKLEGQCITSYWAPDSESFTEIAHADCYNDKRFTPLFFEASESVYGRASYKGHDALFKYDLKKMQMASEPFLSIDGFDFIGWPETDLVAKKVLGIHYDGDAKATVWLDPHFKEIQKKVDDILTQTSNTVRCGSDCLNSPAVLVMATSDRQPKQYFLYTTATGAMIRIGSAYPNINPDQMGTRDFYHYQARDGRSIPVYVTLPPGNVTAPMPTVVLVHGGPNVRGSSWEWEQDAQFLASRGYVVIQPEFRGSTGFGFDHFKAGWKQWGLTMQDDLADAAKWAAQKGWADSKRTAIMGASYGGYATLMGLIKNPEIFRCGVEWAGVTDINMMFDRAESDASQENLNYSMKTLIGDQSVDAEMFKENSPLNHADKLTQPLLIAHGVQDHRVPLVQATEFRDAVKKTNKNVEWIVYTDEGHGWIHEENNIDFWKHVEVFLDKNLKSVE